MPTAMQNNPPIRKRVKISEVYLSCSLEFLVLYSEGVISKRGAPFLPRPLRQKACNRRRYSVMSALSSRSLSRDMGFSCSPGKLVSQPYEAPFTQASVLLGIDTITSAPLV